MTYKINLTFLISRVDPKETQKRQASLINRIDNQDWIHYTDIYDDTVLDGDHVICIDCTAVIDLNPTNESSIYTQIKHKLDEMIRANVKTFPRLIYQSIEGIDDDFYWEN